MASINSLMSFTIPLFLLLTTSTNAHFTLSNPVALGSNSNGENTAPCGGFTPSFAKTTNFYVGGDAIAVVTGHPQVNILIRGTLDGTASGNWTNLFPIVTQYGLGAFCEPIVPAPPGWAGMQGVIQVIEDAEDGILYQCAAVTFQAGKAPSVPSTCTNASSVSASYTTDDKLPKDGAANPAFAAAVSASPSSGAAASGTASTSRASSTLASTTAVAPASSSVSPAASAATTKASGAEALKASSWAPVLFWLCALLFAAGLC